MQLNPSDQAYLREALARLSAGDDRRFEDLLWIGFGDGWRPMLELLVRQRYITIGWADRATPRLIERGEKLLAQLRRMAGRDADRSGSVAGVPGADASALELSSAGRLAG